MFIIYGEREERDCKASKSLTNNVGAPEHHNTEAAFLSSDPCRLQSPGGGSPAHTIRRCSTSTMFNHKNTPSSFLKKNNVHPRSSLPRRCDGWQDVNKGIKSSRPPSSCSGEDEERVGHGDNQSYQSYQCVSVSTRWAWDDIFTTVNTTEAEGR